MFYFKFLVLQGIWRKLCQLMSSTVPQLLSSNGTELIVYILGLVTENKAKSKFFRNFLLQ